MIRNPMDVAARISPELSALIESRINDPDILQPVTLASVRAFVAGAMPVTFAESERLHHVDDGASLLDELDELIDEFGRNVLATDFVQPQASEPLSRVIETVADDENRENPPTLATVREALCDGLASRLIGEGVLEDDEDETLMDEIDALIRRFGEDALAEVFLRID